jgi:hypothetical protein
VSGFSIHQDRSPARSAVAVESGCGVFRNCKLSTGGGVTAQTRTGALLVLAGCWVKGSTGACLSVTGDGRVVAEESVFSRCRSCAIKLRDQALLVLRQCTVKENYRGGIAAIERSRVLIDSSLFEECNIDLGTESSNIIVGSTLNKTGGSEVITAKATELVVADTKFIGSCLDTREHSNVRSVHNVFQTLSMIISGDSTVDSLDDRFYGEAPACVGVSGSANLFLHNVELADVSGNALVVYEDARLQVERGTIRNCQGHAVMAHSGGRLRLSDVAITRVKGFGVLAAHTQETSFTRVIVKQCESSGFEITSATSCQLDDVQITGGSKVGLGLFKSTATINRSEFSGNAFAGCHIGTSTATLIGCEFDGNAKGGIVGAQASRINLLECEFRRNGWGGVYVDSKSSCQADRAVFRANAVGAAIAGEGHFRNSEFAGNEAFGLQATGAATVEECSFQKEATGAVVGEGGRIRVVASNFKDNTLHVGATQRGVVTIEQTTFLTATGGCGVHTGEAAVTIKRCTFDGNRIGLVSEGDTNVSDSHFINSAHYAVMFSGKVRGEIKSSRFEKNGECAFHCLEGRPKILGNRVTNHEKFGIYIIPKSRIQHGQRLDQTLCPLRIAQVRNLAHLHDNALEENQPIPRKLACLMIRREHPCGLFEGIVSVS